MYIVIIFNNIDNNNNNNIHICIAPYGRNFRGADVKYKKGQYGIRNITINNNVEKTRQAGAHVVSVVRILSNVEHMLGLLSALEQIQTKHMNKAVKVKDLCNVS